MSDNITQGKTFTDLKALNQIDGSSLFAVHISGETYKMTYNQLLAQITGDLSYGAYDDIGTRFFSDRKTAPKGCLNCMDGAIYTNADTVYPELWQKIVEGKLNYISMEDYSKELAKVFGEGNSLTGVCGYMGVDIPNKTFRMPTYPSARVAMIIGPEPMFYGDQIVNMTGRITDDNGFNWRNTQSNGVFYNRPNLGAQHWTDDAGRVGNVGVQEYIFDASRQVKTGDQVRTPSTTHCLYMVVSSIRWEIQSVYAFSETVENEVIARTSADIEINNAIAAINEKIEGALTSYYKDTYLELQNFVRDNSAILNVGNVLICGGGSSGEPVRQFLWNGNVMVETSANIVLDNYYSKQQVDNLLNGKVDKIPGKSLSQNDYTNAEKIRLGQSVLEPEYTAFKDKTQKQIEGLTTTIDKEILERKENSIIGGSTEGNSEVSQVEPILYLHKDNGEKIVIPLEVLKNYLNSNSKGINGSVLLENINDEEGEKNTEDLGYFQIRETKTSDNTTSLIKTHRNINDPVRLEFSLFHNTNPNDSIRLVLLNNGQKKRLYLLKDQELPIRTSEINSGDEILNKEEIENYVMEEISEALTGVLPIPTVIQRESSLPDISGGATMVYYFVIENMDISSPNLLRQGRAWCGIGDTTWNKIIDTVNTLSSDSFKQKEDGSWVLNDETQTLIDGAVQSSQITILEPNSGSTDQEILSAKASYISLEKKIDKASIDTLEPTNLSTDDTVTSSKRLNLMMGKSLNSLKTTKKTVVESINELKDDKASISLDNLNQDGINLIASIAGNGGSGGGNNFGQIAYLLFPTNDTRLHLADGSLLAKEGVYSTAYNRLLSLYNSNSCPNLFTSDYMWQQIVNEKGYCPKFVLNNETMSFLSFSRVNDNGEKEIFYNFSTEPEYSMIEDSVNSLIGKDYIDKEIQDLWHFGEADISEDQQLIGVFSTNEDGIKIFTTYEYNGQVEGTVYTADPEYIITVTNPEPTFRIPLLKGYIKGVNNLEDLGEINEAGLPNLTGVNDNSAYNPQGVFYGYPAGGFQSSNGQNPTRLGFDASKSNPIYGRSETVEVDGSNCLVYICLATDIAEEVSAIQNYEVYNTIPLGCPIYSDHLLNDINYLLSANQWNDGTVYTAMYDLLLSEYNNPNSVEVTETIVGTSIEMTYKKTPSKFFITEDAENANNVYNITKASFWVIDRVNSKFKLPQNPKREIVNLVVEGEGENWIKLYNDGWIEQGGIDRQPGGNGKTLNLVIPMANNSYNVLISELHANAGDYSCSIVSLSTNSFVYNRESGSGALFWKVSGYVDSILKNTIDTNHYNMIDKLYYKVGNTTVNSELIDLNNIAGSLSLKADNDLYNIGYWGKRNIRKVGVPDYTAGTSKSLNTEYEVREGFGGILEVWTTKDGNGGATTTITINGISYNYQVDNYGRGGIYRELQYGDTYKVTTSGTVNRLNYFPIITN